MRQAGSSGSREQGETLHAFMQQNLRLVRWMTRYTRSETTTHFQTKKGQTVYFTNNNGNGDNYNVNDNYDILLLKDFHVNDGHGGSGGGRW